MSVATDLKILDYGDHALLLQCESTADVLAWTAALREADLLGVTDIVPASRTVMVKVDGARYLPATRQRIEKLRVVADGEVVTGSVDLTIGVVYDGADLDEVGRITGLGAAGVVAAHTGAPWRVAFGGFVPGFAYLVGGDPRLAVPRRDEPRTRVPAGSVALAGEFSGVYPRETPGGWQLIGHTDETLWDIDRPSPALLTAGMTVAFREAGR
ncbi:MAG TPA: carboxyltransferase domain-containing protein [Mycobacterium sp.]|jgi:KipI family sensor histidine kinase inhibitor